MGEILKINASFNFDELRRRFGEIKERSLPYAVMNALNDTAEIAKSDVKVAMPKVFDRPVPWTVGGVYINKASVKRAKPFAEVGLAGDNETRTFAKTPAGKYLQPEIEGGPRRLLASERALQRVGVMPSGTFWMPGKAARIDAYGNQSVGQIIQMMSFIKAFTEQGYSANITDKKKGKMWKGNRKQPVAYFIGRPGGGKLPLGIYERKLIGQGITAIHPIAIFTKAPNYKPRFAFRSIVRDAFNRYFPLAMSRAWRREVANRKP